MSCLMPTTWHHSHSHQALSAASEARHLEELNDAMVPKLYAQLYELRRAGDAWWRWWMELGVGGYGKM